MDEYLEWPETRELLALTGQADDVNVLGLPRLTLLRDAIVACAGFWSRAVTSYGLAGDGSPTDESLIALRKRFFREASSRLRAIVGIAHEETHESHVRMLHSLEELGDLLSSLSSGEISAASDAAPLVESASEEYGRFARRVWPQLKHDIAQDRAATAATAELRRTLTEVRDIASEAKESAGVVAQSENAKAFEAHAAGEAKAAWWFRLWTYVLFGITTAVLVLPSVVQGLGGPSLFGDEPITAVASRLALGASFAGAAAYTARQAGHHRRVHVWAHSIATQLKSFNAFVAPIDEATVRDNLFDLMGRRMLSEPPHSARSTEGQVDSTSLLQLATEVIRRPSA